MNVDKLIKEILDRQQELAINAMRLPTSFEHYHRMCGEYKGLQTAMDFIQEQLKDTEDN